MTRRLNLEPAGYGCLMAAFFAGPGLRLDLGVLPPALPAFAHRPMGTQH